MLRALSLATVLVLAGAPAAAQTPPPSRIDVVARRTAEGVVVRFELDRPSTRLAFARPSVIRDAWRILTPGLTLADGTISAEAPFDHFEIAISPDVAEVDRTYMGLSRIGEGRVLYGPGLMIEGIETRLTFAADADEIGLPVENAIQGYAYLGPHSAVTETTHGVAVAGANMPTALAQRLETGFLRALDAYGTRLDRPLRYRPMLLASIDSPGPAYFRGDVTDGGVISVRFHGDDWLAPRPSEMTGVDLFVLHEAFHLWNGHLADPTDGDTAPWLHEGGAEYAALKTATALELLDADHGHEQLARRLNGCRRALGDRDFDASRLQSGNGPYNCGVVIQWLADLERRQASGGTQDFYTLWRDLITQALAADGGYGVAQFRAAIGADSAVNVLFDTPGAQRWSVLETRLAALGVTLENRPSDTDLMSSALFHVAARNCKSSYGFYNNPGALKLDGADCGPLSGEPVIDSVEGIDPQSDGRGLFEAIQARCAANLTVRYATRDGRVLEAVCDAPLVEPRVWAVGQAPPLD